MSRLPTLSRQPSARPAKSAADLPAARSPQCVGRRRPLISLENVELDFGDHTILDGIDLCVQPQERVVIMGQSGGGKSTLLRLILGILQPTAGIVRFQGREVNQARPARAERHAGQDRHGLPVLRAHQFSLNVRDNLALPMEELSTEKSEAGDREAPWTKSSNWSRWATSRNRCPPNSAAA